MISKQRIKGTIRSKVQDAYYAAGGKKADESAWEGVAGGVVDSLILLHQEKIAAALRRAGLDVGDNDVLNEASILAMVNKKTGLDIQSFSPDAIADAVAKSISREVSERIGFDVDLTNGIDAALDDIAAKAALSGRVNKVVSPAIARRLKDTAVAAAAGCSVDDVRRVRKNFNQRQYNHSVSTVWVDR
jgi:hypothetical protein